MRISRRVLEIVLVPALVILAGCAGKVRYPNYYVLNLPYPVLPAADVAPVFGPLAVRQFDAPAFLRAGPIAYRESAAQLGFYDYHRWATDPRQAVSMAVIHELQARGAFRSVALFDGHGSPDWVVTGAIDHMEEVDDGANVSVEIALSAQLVDEKTGDVVWQGNASRNLKLDHHSVHGVVALMSEGLGVAVRELVSSLQGRLPASRPSDR
jgi:uncharacterized lipoprotein YmbA